MKPEQETTDRLALDRAIILAQEIWKMLQSDINDESAMAIYVKALQRCDKLEAQIKEKYEN